MILNTKYDDVYIFAKTVERLIPIFNFKASDWGDYDDKDELISSLW